MIDDLCRTWLPEGNVHPAVPPAKKKTWACCIRYDSVQALTAIDG
jgi:hypothetical protein